jgi:hypothetical protein
MFFQLLSPAAAAGIFFPIKK